MTGETSARAAECLNLGCGADYREGDVWHNVDIRPEVNPDMVVDLNTYPWPWNDGAFDRVLASHVIEHLADQHRALHELARVAAPGGVVRVRAPHWHSASTAIDPTHAHPIDPRTLTHDLAPDWTVMSVDVVAVRGGQLLPDRLALWLADMVGHLVVEWTATIHIPAE